MNQFEEIELAKLTETFLCVFSSTDMQQKCTEFVNVDSGR